jgi:hypothetical protein
VADQNALPGYDGAASINGITRAFHIATHAYMKGEVVSRATALKGASVQIKPARQGSFVFELIVFIEAYPATSTIAAAIGAPMFYDFIKTAFKRATGSLNAEPETTALRRLYERREPPPLKKPPADLDELSEALEGSLQAAHRPIGCENSVSRISIGTPRNALLEFDSETKDWVNTQEESAGLELVTGNVTRYNSISRNARVFVDQFDKVVPIRPDGDFPSGNLQFLTWSLHGSNIGVRNRLDMKVRRVSSASGKIKRLLLSDCQRTAAD